MLAHSVPVSMALMAELKTHRRWVLFTLTWAIRSLLCFLNQVSSLLAPYGIHISDDIWTERRFALSQALMATKRAKGICSITWYTTHRPLY